MPGNTTKSSKNLEHSTEHHGQQDTLSAAEFLMKWNAELTRFYAQRYQQYWLMPFKLLSCRSLDDFQVLQEEFRNELFENYRTEAARLAAIANAVSDSSDEFGKDYAASLLKAQEDAATIISQAKEQAERIMGAAHQKAEELIPSQEGDLARKQA